MIKLVSLLMLCAGLCALNNVKLMAAQATPPAKTEKEQKQKEKDDGKKPGTKTGNRNNVPPGRLSSVGASAADNGQAVALPTPAPSVQIEKRWKEEEIKDIARAIWQDEYEKRNSGLQFFASAVWMLIPLLGLVLLFLWINRRLSDSERNHVLLRRETANVQQWATSLDNFQQVLDAHEQDLDQLRAHSPVRLKAELKAELFNELRASLQAANPRASAAASPPEQSYAPAAYEAPPPKLWPAKVSVCLHRVGNDGISAKRTYMRGDLLQETATGSEDGLYVLARDPQQNGLYVVIPSISRFNSSQDYNHYSTFYDCDRPVAGEVWVLEPALASYEESSGHWRLQQKGRLQIG